MAYIYIYIYYVCVCVCVCVYLAITSLRYFELKAIIESQLILRDKKTKKIQTAGETMHHPGALTSLTLLANFEQFGEPCCGVCKSLLSLVYIRLVVVCFGLQTLEMHSFYLY